MTSEEGLGWGDETQTPGAQQLSQGPRLEWTFTYDLEEGWREAGRWQTGGWRGRAGWMDNQQGAVERVT